MSRSQAHPAPTRRGKPLLFVPDASRTRYDDPRMKPTLSVKSPKGLNCGDARIAHGLRQSVEVTFHTHERHPSSLRIRLEGDAAFQDPEELSVTASSPNWPNLIAGVAVLHPDARGYDVHLCTPIQPFGDNRYRIYLNGTRNVVIGAASTPAQEPGALISPFPGEIITSEHFTRVVCEAPRPYRPSTRLPAEPLRHWTGTLPDMPQLPEVPGTSTPAVVHGPDSDSHVQVTVEAAQEILRSRPAWLTPESEAFIERLKIPVI